MSLELIAQNFHWLRPVWLLAIPMLVLGWAVLSRAGRQHDGGSRLLAPHIERLLSNRAERRKIVTPLNTLLLLTFCCILALAGPTWQRQSSPLSEDEAMLLVVLDASRSMLQTDVQPSRLERSKQKINDLLAMRAGARSGLIVYSGSAHTVIPLTNDLDIVWHFLDAIDNEMMPRQGKSAASVIPVLDKILSQSEYIASGVPASVLLITDSVEPDSEQLLADYFARLPHQLLILGVGKNQRGDASGSAYGLDYTPLDEDSLRELADQTNAHYQSLSADQQDMRQINWRIKNHYLFVDDEQRPWIDAGYYLLFPIVVLCLLTFRRGWTIQYCWALGLVLGLGLTDSKVAYAQTPPADETQHDNTLMQRFIDLWVSKDQQARYFFERGEYQRAAGLYGSAMSRGVALYMNEQFIEAAEVFASVNSDNGLFNQANALAHAQHYVKAVELYTELLNRAPDHTAAAKNRRIIQTLIDDINRMSESQQAEPGELSRELGNAPQRADGADQQSMEQRTQAQFNADQILSDERIQQQWMKQVQQNPARFLAVKFQMQLQSNSSAAEGRDER